MKNEKEYIEREAVLTVLKTVFDETDPCGEEQFGILKAHRIVREAPAADVVEVVRCGNCKHWASYRFAKYGRYMCVEEIIEGQWHTQEDDFCSYGERKE